MDLRSALKKACSFAAKDGFVCTGPAVFHPEKEIVLVDGVALPHRNAYVHATDGVTHWMAWLDPGLPVPASAMEAAPLKKALSQLAKGKHAQVILEKTGPTTTALRGPNAVVHLQGDIPPVLSPQPPPGRGSFLTTEDASRLLRVLHAAASERAEDKTEVTAVHLTPSFAEATDQSRVARAGIGLPLEPVLVAPKLFEQWTPGGEFTQSFYFSQGYLVLQAGEELRWTPAAPATTFVDLSSFMLKDHNQRADCLVGPLLNAVKTAKAASPIGVVEMAFSTGSVEVRGMAEDGRVGGLTQLSADGAGEPAHVVLRAKLLMEALSEFSERHVTLHYSDSTQPLRLSSPGYQELIWPLCLPEEP